MHTALAGVVLAIGLVQTCRAVHTSVGRVPRHHSTHMKADRSDSIGGPGVTWTPNDNLYESVVIWMHGLGDTADGWASLSKRV